MKIIELESDKVRSSYDAEADVMYISFGPPVPSTSIEVDAVARINPKTGKLSGITIISYKRQLKEQL